MSTPSGMTSVLDATICFMELPVCTSSVTSRGRGLRRARWSRRRCRPRKLKNPAASHAFYMWGSPALSFLSEEDHDDAYDPISSGSQNTGTNGTTCRETIQIV